MFGDTGYVCVVRNKETKVYAIGVSRDTDEKFEDLGVGDKNDLVMNYWVINNDDVTRKLYKKFRGVLSENMIVLRGSHDATENVIKIVIDAVKKERGIQANTAPAFKARPQGYKAYANA